MTDSLTPISMDATTRVLADLFAERQRQIEQEDWSLAHDDVHKNGELARAAAVYAIVGAAAESERLALRERNWGFTRITTLARGLWPWDFKWLKPETRLSDIQNRRRDYVRSGALIVAEIERMDRMERTS